VKMTPQFILSTLKCNNMTPKALKLHLESIKLQKSFYSSNFFNFTCSVMSRFAKLQVFFFDHSHPWLHIFLWSRLCYQLLLFFQPVPPLPPVAVQGLPDPVVTDVNDLSSSEPPPALPQKRYKSRKITSWILYIYCASRPNKHLHALSLFGVNVKAFSLGGTRHLKCFAYYCVPFRPSNSDFSYIEERESTSGYTFTFTPPPVWDLLLALA
jgi:hypothetical protein